MTITDYIYSDLDAGKVVISVLLEFKKAFDCGDHKNLLKKVEKYGVRDNVLKWFESYFSSCVKYVATKSSESRIFPITHGVPQGSILGLLFFLLFKNDFPTSCSFLIFILFANATTIYCSFDKFDEEFITRKMNQDLGIITPLLSDNKIKVNHSK